MDKVIKQTTRSMQSVFTCDHGTAVFAFPSNLSMEDVKDIEDWMTIMLRIVRKRGEKSLLTTNQAAASLTAAKEPVV